MSTPTVKLVDGSSFPIVGLGTWPSADEKVLETALDVALENGYRHIDTAFVYRNEHIVGKVLQNWFNSGKLKREDLFVTTKLPMEGVNPEGVEKFIKKSLESLKLDYVDLYLIHFPVCTTSQETATSTVSTRPTDHIAVWKEMEKQVDAGRTKTIGLSNFNIQQIDRILKNSRIKPASLQVEIHIFLPQNELVKFAQDNGIVVVAFSPLTNPSMNKWLVKMGLPPKDRPSIFTNSTINKIADKHKKSPAQVALKHLLQRKLVVIPKSTTPNRINENIDLFNFTLDAEDMAAIKQLEIGENARVCDFAMLPVLAEHPEWPFPKH